MSKERMRIANICLTITNTLDLSQSPRELHKIQEVPGVFMFMYKEIFYLFTLISTKK